jgi:hypothetical protein
MLLSLVETLPAGQMGGECCKDKLAAIGPHLCHFFNRLKHFHSKWHKPIL